MYNNVSILKIKIKLSCTRNFSSLSLFTSAVDSCPSEREQSYRCILGVSHLMEWPSSCVDRTHNGYVGISQT